MRLFLLRQLISVCLFAAFFALASCKGGSAASVSDNRGDSVSIKYASNLSIVDFGDYTEVKVRNPWDTTRLLQTYILIEIDKDLPDIVPKGTVIRTPARNALVYSTVHNAMLNSIGASEIIGGVCNSKYINTPEIRSRIESGEIIDCGNSMTPNLERIIMLRPDVIMLSPFENNDRYGKVADMGIPIIECADYMETSPLGRAEWLKFYGRLTGHTAQADSIFEETERRYLALKEAVEDTAERPKVIIDQRYGQVWNVPSAQSTMATFIRDAGGVNPFDYIPGSGNNPVAPERVLSEAHDATVWFVRYNQKNDKTMAELATDAAVNSRFAAFRNGNVYGCNTGKVDFYEEVPFAPHLLLEDMIKVLHPGVLPDSTLRYYTKLKDR